MKLHKSLPWLAAVFAIHGHLYAAAIYTETWDNGMLNDWTGNTTVTTVEAKGSGGNPNGWLYSYGVGVDSFDIGAKTERSEATGNFNDVPITKVSVDISFISGDFDDAWLRFRYKDATENGWVYSLADTFGRGWNTYSVAFDPSWSDAEAKAAGWLTDREAVSPTADPSQSFALTMSDVYTAEVRISGEGFLEAGIDNFRMIPEPATMSLLALLMGGIWFKRRLFPSV